MLKSVVVYPCRVCPYSDPVSCIGCKSLEAYNQWLVSIQSKYPSNTAFLLKQLSEFYAEQELLSNKCSQIEKSLPSELVK